MTDAPTSSPLHGTADAAPALVVGEALVDVVVRDGADPVEHPGGSAANVAVALARLGRPVGFATAWADDDRGRVLAAHVARDGVRVVGDAVVLDRTSTAVATIGAGGAASYAFDLDWRLGPVPELAPRVVHVCSIAAVLDPGRHDVLDVLRRERGRATTSYDVNVRASITPVDDDLRARVGEVVALADLVKASDEDLEQLRPDLDLEAAARSLLGPAGRGAGPVAVVVTRGGDGATVVTEQGRVDVATPSVEVADTIGAGDTFMAGLLDALWERGALGADGRRAIGELDEDAWASVLAHAARAAAINVSRPGADPPTRAELGRPPAR